MKKVTAKFSIATTYVRSDYSEEQEFEFDDDASDDEIEEEICSAYETWLSNHNYGGWSITNTETIPDEE